MESSERRSQIAGKRKRRIKRLHCPLERAKFPNAQQSAQLQIQIQMNADSKSPSALHPFFEAGMGEGPYRFLYAYDMGEAMNPNSAANFGNMRGWIADAPKLEAGLGTCVCCGKGISIICVVRNAAGKLYGVGSDCVEKCDDEGIMKKGVAATLAIRRKELARQKREAARAAKWEAERPAREAALREAAARDLAECKERYMQQARNAPVIAYFYGDALTACTGRREAPGSGWGSEVMLDNWNRWYSPTGGFRASILCDLMNGVPAESLSPRVRAILCDIKAKGAGRANSKAYNAAYEAAQEIFAIAAL